MSIITIPTCFVPSPAYTSATGAPSLATSGVMNASGDRLAFIIRVPKSGELQFFEFRSAAVSNNPDNGIRLSFQDISLATGLPDGVVDQFVDITGAIAANTWQVPSGPMTNDGTGGGTKRTVTAGDYLCCVIDFVSFVALDTFQISLLNNSTSVVDGSQDQYTGDGSGGSYTKSADQPVLALKYADGTYGELTLANAPITTINTRTFNNTSTPDERALRFQVPVDMRCIGFWVRMDPDAAVDVILYDNTDTPVGSCSYDPDARMQAAGLIYFGRFAPVTIPANTTYRLAVKPTSASNVIMYDFDVDANALLECVPGGIEWSSSTRTDAGAWTPVLTNRPYMGLIFNGIEASGGGEHSSVF